VQTLYVTEEVTYSSMCKDDACKAIYDINMFDTLEIAPAKPLKSWKVVSSSEWAELMNDMKPDMPRGLNKTMYHELDARDKKLVKLQEDLVQGGKAQGASKKHQKTAANTQAKSEAISRWSPGVTSSQAESSTMGAAKGKGKCKRVSERGEEAHVLGSEE
jgi:hypothetical protein